MINNESLPSCKETPYVTKGRLAGTNKGRTEIIEGKKKSCYKTDRISKSMTRYEQEVVKKSMQIRYEKLDRTDNACQTVKEHEPIDKAYYIC